MSIHRSTLCVYALSGTGWVAVSYLIKHANLRDTGQVGECVIKVAIPLTKRALTPECEMDHQQETGHWDTSKHFTDVQIIRVQPH